ncbi:unnamed protein product, partial [Porites evermanni]
MNGGDVLGKEGRKALNACVKVKIFGRRQTRLYDYDATHLRLSKCFGGNFPDRQPWPQPYFGCRDPEETPLLTKEKVLQLLLPSSEDRGIIDIYDNCLLRFDDIPYVEKYPAVEGKLKNLVDKRRADVETEVKEATANPDQRHRYSWLVVQRRVRDCFAGTFAGDASLLPKHMYMYKSETYSIYDIFDICRTLCKSDGKKFYHPRKSSDVLLRININAHRTDLEKEYQQDKANNVKRRYTRSEAERRVRDCFAGSFVCDYTDIFASKSVENGEKKIDQTYNIFDIQSAIRYFDSKKLDKYPEEEGPEADDKRKLVDKERAAIKKEYDEATAIVEIEHGSGFILQEHFVITNKHVIESALNDNSNKTRILISNAALGEHELPCKIAHYDAGKDLALLYCQDLEMNPIHPLQLSNQPLLPGMQVFSFGFSISHTEDTALFVNGYVSGSKKTLQGHTMAVLNCPLNSGNSGGPVLCWVEGQLKVVGVATQKHFKDILTLSERMTVAAIQEKMQASVIPDVSEYLKAARYGDLPRLGKTSIYLLTLKLYDALETHSQFNLSNALPGAQV